MSGTQIQGKDTAKMGFFLFVCLCVCEKLTLNDYTDYLSYRLKLLKTYLNPS